MKRYIRVIGSALVMICLTACGKGESSNTAKSDTTKSDTVKEISCSDILNITEDMSYEQVMNTLGETVHDDSFAWFLYSVDGMQYLQTIPQYDEEIGKNGKELLQDIICQNIETAPQFISVSEAAVLLSTTPVGTQPFRIAYADSDDVIASIGDTGELSFRYNINDNTIDRAFSCVGFNTFRETQNCASIVGLSVSKEGDYAKVEVVTSGENKDSLAYREFLPSEYVYMADFEQEEVKLLSQDEQESEKYSNDNFYVLEEEYGATAKKYSESTNADSSLLKLQASDAIAQIDDDRYCMIVKDSNDTAEDGYLNYKFVIVDVKENAVIQECKFR